MWGSAVGRLLVVVILALALVPVGFASGGGQKSSSVAGYSGVAGATQTKVNSGGPTGPAGSSTSAATPTGTTSTPSGTASTPSGTTSTLPFTGIDLAYVLIGGLALVGVGMAVRRASRPRDLTS
jgi:hypothetical protein